MKSRRIAFILSSMFFSEFNQLRKDAPKITPSMKTALSDLELLQLTVVYPGEKPYKLAAEINVMPFSYFATSEIEAITQ